MSVCLTSAAHAGTRRTEKCDDERDVEGKPCLRMSLQIPVCHGILGVMLVNHAKDTMTNRYLKAHAQAWFTFKYSSWQELQSGPPPAFSDMVIQLNASSVYQVRKVRWEVGGKSEHQDLAPHEVD